LELGANDFLLKPLQPAELTHRARNLLDMRAAHRTLHRRQRWLEEAERFSRELFSGELYAPLDTIARRAMALSDADHVLTLGDRPRTALEGGRPPAPRRLSTSRSGEDGDLDFEIRGALQVQLCHEATPVLLEDAL